MADEIGSAIGHAIIWIALLIGLVALLGTNPTVEDLRDTIKLMGLLTALGGIIVLRCQHETKKQKVYVLGETPSSKS